MKKICLYVYIYFYKSLLTYKNIYQVVTEIINSITYLFTLHEHADARYSIKFS